MAECWVMPETLVIANYHLKSNIKDLGIIVFIYCRWVIKLCTDPIFGNMSAGRGRILVERKIKHPSGRDRVAAK